MLTALAFQSILQDDSPQTREDFFQGILQKLPKSLSWDLAIFFQGSNLAEAEILFSASASGKNFSSCTEIEFFSPLIQRTTQTNAICHSQNLQTDDYAMEFPVIKNMGLRGALVVPAQNNGRILGFIYFDSRSKSFQLNAAEKKALTFLGQLLGMWLQLREGRLRSNKEKKLLEFGGQAAAVMHDLRNLFSLLWGRVQLSQAEPKNILESLNKLEADIVLGKNRLEEMLSYGQWKNRQKLDLRDVLDATLKRLTFLRETETPIQFHLHPGGPFFIKGRAAALTDAFTNLLLNALDATRWSGHIEIALSRDQQTIQVRIADTGMGMGKDFASKLSQPFMTSWKHDGMGLGLFSTRKIIEQHNGIMEVTSVPRFGTTFDISFPSLVEENGQKKILLIDDEIETFQHLRNMLPMDQYSMEGITEIEEAWRFLEEIACDFVLVDYGMSALNGLEILERLRRRNQQIPIILMVAKTSSFMSNLHDCQVIAKPIRMPLLRKALERVPAKTAIS